MKKVTIASTRDRSFSIASSNLADLAELDVPAKQCQRTAIRIGTERLDEQEIRIEQYKQASIPEQQHGQPAEAPSNSWNGRVAVVQCDGGRSQIRDEYWGNEKPKGKRHRWWRETQCGVLQTLLSTPSEQDPTPEVPDALKDSLWVVPRLNEIHRMHVSPENSNETETQSGRPEQDNDTSPSSERAEQPTDNQNNKDKRWSGGEPLVKSVIASRRGYEHLGVAMAAEAYHRGFNKSTQRAFMGDGLKVNWSVWKAHFSHYTPITDIMHALSYVYGAAVASSERIEEGWELYLRWLQLFWAGMVYEVIMEMKSIQKSRATEIDALNRSITYLSNNAERMKYAEYRKAGLPITTSLVESTQKQINARIKGTEKFWRDESIEPMLQLIADDLSETRDSEDFWNRRQSRFDGFRRRKPRAKTTKA
ncbi:MAG TPA: hypothetical protein VM260_18255 [Pirellula sp.]|nr:hypothetical protein [Pirellula sp.]